MVEPTQTLDLEGLNADQTLDALIEVRRAIDWLKARDASLLDRLDELAAAGEIDQGGFTHNDWSFAHSEGKTVYTYPEQITELEAQLKAAKDAAKAAGTATKTTGNPFWIIKRPGS